MGDEVALLVADVYELAGLLRRTGEAAAAQEGQTQARWQLLSAISEESLTVPQAARRLGVTRQGVQRVANDLLAANLVELTVNPDHRTSPLLALTDSGRITLRALTRRARVMNERVGVALGAAGVAKTRSGVRELIAVLKN
jgi:DNA-binding MarR family transcriptional regulator